MSAAPGVRVPPRQSPSPAPLSSRLSTDLSRFRWRPVTARQPTAAGTALSFVAGRAAAQASGIAMGLLFVGSATEKGEEMLAYAHDTQHEKIIRGLALGLALTMYARCALQPPRLQGKAGERKAARSPALPAGMAVHHPGRLPQDPPSRIGMPAASTLVCDACHYRPRAPAFRAQQACCAGCCTSLPCQAAVMPVPMFPARPACLQPPTLLNSCW